MKKVLIIEDDKWLAQNYQLLLEKNGWQVELTSLASQAIDLIDDLKPDVLLLDFILPEKNAPTLLNELQSHTDTATLPVVLCTSLPREGIDTSALKQYGVQSLIDKTIVTPSEMLKVLNTFITHEPA